ncbi:rhodanese-related sulfurtransferase [Prochlorococcus sp. MIT 1307]|uniref:oxygen-dependent tRNA uridine(34) hydroxylase TrhO n=1 Tax=Prochlorococcus sp. MIT 1307 TaxID=3096219 RepID=UPI002A75F30B|nr:rhodanese-related sulfurtransferase [Prochlorococcus sp. MIT 1307]
MKNPEEVLPADKLQVAAFYCFIPIEEETIDILLTQLTKNALQGQVRGTILLAGEGVNGTICGPSEGVVSLLENLRQSVFGMTLEVKVSWTDTQAFRRFKARRKSEIVTMGVAGIDPLKSVGAYVNPFNWNTYLSDPDTLVIDTRNEYEIGIGSFQGAINPNTNTFRDFPAWVDASLPWIVEQRGPKRIAMFCTGGIRCEKATSYLLQKGFKDVHHLQGGILRYLEEVPEEESLWDGECFVFDKRVAVNHKLQPGQHTMCHACGMPLARKELQTSTYIHGVQCSHCKDRYTDQDRGRFAERQRQIDERSKNSQKTFPRKSL